MSILVDTPPPQQQVRRKFSVDFAATKSAESAEGVLELRGYASTWVQDRDGDWMAPEAFDKSLPNYLKKNPILLWQHNMRQPIGTVDEAVVDAAGLKVVCSIPQPEQGEEPWKVSAYHDVKRGIVKTFSVGGFFGYDVENIGEDEEKWIIREVELLEISVVSIPSNPDSIFEAAVKAFKDADAPTERMADQAFNQMLQLLGVEPTTDPQLLSMDDAAKDARWKDLSGLFQRVKGRAAPDRDAYMRITAPAAAPDASLAAKLAVLPAIEALMGELYAPPAVRSAPVNSVRITKSHRDQLHQVRGWIDSFLDEAEVGD